MYGGITSHPKVIWEEHIATPHGKECTRLHHVLAVQCPLQTSHMRHIHTTVTHASYSLRYIALSNLQPPKRNLSTQCMNRAAATYQLLS